MEDRRSPETFSGFLSEVDFCVRLEQFRLKVRDSRKWGQQIIPNVNRSLRGTNSQRAGLNLRQAMEVRDLL